MSSSGSNRNAAFSGNETILLAEDNESLRDLAASVLRRHGYSVLIAERLEDLDRIASTSVVIDLLLTDVVIPGATGRQMADRCHLFWPDASVVFMSGYSEAILLGDGLIDAGSNFLQKPFSPAGLATKIRDVLDAQDDAASIA